MKDPTIRIRDFDSAALPTPYRLEFDLLVYEPRVVEQSAHRHLADLREGREWFRCSVQIARAAIYRAAGISNGDEAFDAADNTDGGHEPTQDDQRHPDAIFDEPLKPSVWLSAVVGSDPLPRTEVVRRLWDYIKRNRLQDTGNRRMINADEKLKWVFGKSQVSMFEMTKLVGEHLKYLNEKK